MTPQPPPLPRPVSDPFETDEKPRNTDDSIGFDPTPTGGRSGTVPRIEGGEPVTGYRLVLRLGSGGFGEVWKAIGPGGFAVAMKFIDLGRAAGKFEVRSLEVMKEIRHAHLLAMFGSWRVSDFLVIAMELAEQTLLERLHTHQGKGLPGIPSAELMTYMAEAAKGLDHLNLERRIQHRDIKPHNLLLVGGTVKVADFGLAKLLDSAQGNRSGSGQSFPYAAPEFFREQTTLTSDQYSLAITYCHLRGGKVPFMGSQAQIISGHLSQPPDLSMLPPEERAIVSRALAKIPPERWPSCKEFVAALHRRSTLETLPEPSQLTALPGDIPLPVATVLPTRPRPVPKRPSSTGLPLPPPLPKHRFRRRTNRRLFLWMIVLGATVLGLLLVVLIYLVFKLLP